MTAREAERQKNVYEDLVARKEKANENFKNVGGLIVNKKLDFQQPQKAKDKYDVENMDHEQIAEVKEKEKQEFNENVDHL